MRDAPATPHRLASLLLAAVAAAIAAPLVAAGSDGAVPAAAGAVQMPPLQPQPQIPPDPAAWQLSSHECPPPSIPNPNPRTPRTCTFRNLYLWGGRAYYLTEGPPPDFNGLGLDLDMWTHKAVGPHFMTAATPAAFSAMLAKEGWTGPAGGTGRSSSGDGGAGGQSSGSGEPAADGADMRIPLAVFWRPYRVEIDPASGAHCDGNATAPGRSNYYHMLAEYFPLLTVYLCEQWGHCDPWNNRSALQLIDVMPSMEGNINIRCHQSENYPPFFQEGAACFSDQPMRHIAGPAFRGKLVHVQTGWVGMGPQCRGFLPPSGCYRPGCKRTPVTSAQMEGWLRLAEQCFGVPLQQQAPLRPARVLVVDRLYETGRSFLNVGTLVQAIRARVPPELVEVQLEYMEGLSIRQQAALFSNATVVVHMHGAAMGNYFFLPRNAVSVHLSPFPGRWPPYLAHMMARDVQNLTDFEVRHWLNTDWSRVQVVPPVVEYLAAAKPLFAELIKNKTFYDRYKGTLECPESLGRLRFQCTQFLPRALTAALPAQVVADHADWAVKRAFEKQQQEWPPTAPAGGAANGADAAAAPGDDGQEQQEQQERKQQRRAWHQSMGPLRAVGFVVVLAAVGCALFLLWRSDGTLPHRWTALPGGQAGKPQPP